MTQFEMTPSSAFETSTVRTAERVTSFLRAVYGWMFVGLGITASVAYGVAYSGFAQVIATNRLLFWGLWLVPLGLGFVLQGRVDRMTPATAGTLFVIYSASIGAWLSIIFLVYAHTAIASAFFVTAGMFGAVAVLGTVTRRSLAGVGQFAYMGFIGIFLALLASVFIRPLAANAGLQFVISVAGVIVFTALTAWAAQRLKQMAATVPAERFTSYAVVGALHLYINFINLFLMLLRLLGGGGRRS